jgi:hypothetical protein
MDFFRPQVLSISATTPTSKSDVQGILYFMIEVANYRIIAIKFHLNLTQ